MTTPKPEEEKKMLRDKTKYMNNADKYSTKKQAFKEGWKAGYAAASAPSSEARSKEEILKEKLNDFDFRFIRPYHGYIFNAMEEYKNQPASTDSKEAVEFAEWVANGCFGYNSKMKWWEDLKDNKYTTAELYNLFSPKEAGERR